MMGRGAGPLGTSSSESSVHSVAVVVNAVHQNWTPQFRSSGTESMDAEGVSKGWAWRRTPDPHTRQAEVDDL